MKIIKFKKDNKIIWGKYNDENKSITSYESRLTNVQSFEEIIQYFDDHNITNNMPKYSLDEVELLAPVQPSQNIFCIGKNYMDHILEFDGAMSNLDAIKENPIFFTKAISSINNPYGNIPSHSNITKAMDYEGELGIIIGKKGINIPKEEAMQYIYGYTIINDITARDLQKSHLQWFKGKSLDGFCPIGPWIVTRDEICDVESLEIICKVNNEVRQQAKVELMIHNISSIISVLSQGMTLNPGDIIATGTPKGVGMGFNPPKYLKSKDIIRVEISQIGYIENEVK